MSGGCVIYAEESYCLSGGGLCYLCWRIILIVRGWVVLFTLENHTDRQGVGCVIYAGKSY
jgi:hypothetical protein